MDSKQKLFMELYQPLHPRISNYCRAITGQNETAKDLLSETILNAYENFDKLKKHDAFIYYLFGIASNLFKKQLRRKKFSATYEPESELKITDTKVNSEDWVDVSILYEQLKKLPNKQREAIILFEINGFSIEEIQTIQKGSISGVKSRLSRGRMKLKQLLEVESN